MTSVQVRKCPARARLKSCLHIHDNSFHFTVPIVVIQLTSHRGDFVNALDWITISDYSSQFRVSVSTLRRKIKSKACEFTFEDGKYFLRNKPLKEHRALTVKPKLQEPVPAVAPPPHQTQVQVRQQHGEIESSRVATGSTEAGVTLSLDSMNRGFSETARELMGELKGAYTLILHEKEEMILQLKDEVADLKTLARILEDENLRLKESLAKAQSIDQWLGTIET